MLRPKAFISVLFGTFLLAAGMAPAQAVTTGEPRSLDLTSVSRKMTGWVDEVGGKLGLSDDQIAGMKAIYLKEVESAITTGPADLSKSEESLVQPILASWEKTNVIHQAVDRMLDDMQYERYLQLEKERMVASRIGGLEVLDLTPVQKAKVRESVDREVDFALKQEQRFNTSRTDLANKVRRRIVQTERDIESILSTEQKAEYEQFRMSSSKNVLHYLG